MDRTLILQKPGIGGELTRLHLTNEAEFVGMKAGLVDIGFGHGLKLFDGGGGRR
ncbi:hypothetical protein GCM10011402_28950 [Paracoccus acridae]|uniref:Uncharacterized protein n=1 Tax=Paracoccus acridae TaxID=1795310 RepID=A0ABQ1VK30_9RHOB|nr:hypothetical protein GCM10011402_28950 [Paracoccus acridae]